MDCGDGNAQTVAPEERQHRQIEMILFKEMDITGIYLMWQQWKLGNACQRNLQAEANRDTPVGSLVNQAFGGLNEEFLQAMPARKTVTARLTHHRNKDIGAVNRGERSVNWPVHMKNTNEGEQFLYYDSAANGFRVELLPAGFLGPARLEPRHLIFATDVTLQLKSNREHARSGENKEKPKSSVASQRRHEIKEGNLLA
uniref:Uncharacterized protein n=1 Tax=Ditylenchus dipsaci TaxID=166011 RepID=A0A915E3E2_9BILA